MIERLNFYDLYGYLLPGLTLIAFLWLPYRIVRNQPLPTAISSILLAVWVAYIIGHLLQSMARLAFPSRKGGRTFGDLLLDDSEKTLSLELKTRLSDKINARFGIKVSDTTSPDPGTRERRRTDALLLCRGALLQEKAGAYAEQAEGMYSLMRGVAAACILGGAYEAGWAISVWLPALWKGWFLSVLLTCCVGGALLFYLVYKGVFWLRRRLKGRDHDEAWQNPTSSLNPLSNRQRKIKRVADLAFDHRG